MEYSRTRLWLEFLFARRKGNCCCNWRRAPLTAYRSWEHLLKRIINYTQLVHYDTTQKYFHIQPLAEVWTNKYRRLTHFTHSHTHKKKRETTNFLYSSVSETGIPKSCWSLLLFFFFFLHRDIGQGQTGQSTSDFHFIPSPFPKSRQVFNSSTDICYRLCRFSIFTFFAWSLETEFKRTK